MRGDISTAILSALASSDFRISDLVEHISQVQGATKISVEVTIDFLVRNDRLVIREGIVSSKKS